MNLQKFNLVLILLGIHCTTFRIRFCWYCWCWAGAFKVGNYSAFSFNVLIFIHFILSLCWVFFLLSFALWLIITMWKFSARQIVDNGVLYGIAESHLRLFIKCLRSDGNLGRVHQPFTLLPATRWWAQPLCRLISKGNTPPTNLILLPIITLIFNSNRNEWIIQRF